MNKAPDVRFRYSLPVDVRFCAKCTISNQRPRITFNKDGICSACVFANQKKSINWQEREDQLASLCNRYRRTRGYDVLVPCSGGKDGGFTAHYLKLRFGMKPLTCTWAPNIYTDVGWTNLQNFIDVGGFDNVLGQPNGQVNRKLVRLAFEHLGDPFQPFIYGQTHFPLRVALHHEIQLIMYGENGEVEYGGDMSRANLPTRNIDDHGKHYFSEIAPEAWVKHGLNERELEPYMAPYAHQVSAAGIEIHFMGYYRSWDPQENYYYCTAHTGFSPSPERSEGTYSKYASIDDKLDGFHYYLGFIKFGIGRATSDSAHEIRDGKITRDEGIALVKKYDGEFPRRHYETFLSYASLTEPEFERIVDSWRTPHIWQRAGHNAPWQLRYAIWR